LRAENFEKPVEEEKKSKVAEKFLEARNLPKLIDVKKVELKPKVQTKEDEKIAKNVDNFFANQDKKKELGEDEK